MIIRIRSCVKIAVPSFLLAAFCACGNNGAPPYAPEAPRAPPRASAPSSMLAAATGTPSDPHMLYDLREKCAADALQWYRHFYEESGMYPAQSTLSHGFTSHYNSKTNDCFAVTSAINRIQDTPSKKARLVEMHNLTDVLENRNVGTYSAPAAATEPAESAPPGQSGDPTECRVAEKRCSSKDDWDTLTAPYMTD